MAQKKPTIDLGTVLVVGGCGFLGWNIVNQLLNFPSETDPSAALPTVENDARFKFPTLHGRYPHVFAKVHVVDLRTTNNRLPGAQYHDGDITSSDAMLELFKKIKPDVVINTASPSMLTASKELLHKVNVDGTRTLVEVAGGALGDWGGKCKAFVYTSSSSVVHDTRSDLINVNEKWPLVRGPMQGEYYTETKADGEDIVLKANRSTPSGMLTCAVRPAGIFGEKDTTVSYKVLEHGREASNTSIRMQLGDNNNLFDFTYVGNVAYAHTLAAYRLLATYTRYETGKDAPLDYERVDGEAFNITNDEPMYFWDYARALWSYTDRYVEPSQVWPLPEGALAVIGTVVEGLYSLLGKTPRLTSKAVRFSCMTRYYSCQKAKDRLGYTPVVDISEAIARTVGYWIASGSAAKNKKEL